MNASALRALLLAFSIIASLEGGTASAQVPTEAAGDTIWRVELADGTTFDATISSQSADSITFTTQGGAAIAVSRNRVIAMVPASAATDYPADPNVTRLFFGPTARMMRAGEGYIAAYELFLPFLSYSPTDWFAIAAGTPLIPEVIGQIVYVAPKVGMEVRPDLAVAAGVIAFVSSENDFESAGIGYGAVTLGGPDRAVTAAVGYPFADGDLANLPLFMAGGELRAGRRIKLISENYVFSLDQGDGNIYETERSGLLSAGIRFIGDRLSADLGIGYAFDGDDSVCCVPLVNFVYNFGND